MAVKVLISRRFQEGKALEVISLFNQLRKYALEQPGYISGETLHSQDDPQKFLVVASWETVEDWLQWKDHPQRKAEEEKLQKLLQGPPEYEIFVPATYPFR